MQQLLFLFLGIEALEDIHTYTIRMDIVCIFGILGLITQIVQREMSVTLLISGIAIGVLLLLLSRWNRMGIGSGDGWAFVVTGVYLGGIKNVLLCYMSLVMAGMIGGGISIYKKLRGSSAPKRYPFMPFIFGAYCILCLMGM